MIENKEYTYDKRIVLLPCKECKIKPDAGKRNGAWWLICPKCKKKTFNYVRVYDSDLEWNKLNE